MVRVGFTEYLTEDDTLALLRRVHRLANPDSEFDFHDSFWRYEVAVSRHRRDDQTQVSPNDLLLELKQAERPGEARDPDRNETSLSRFQTLFGPTRHTSPDPQEASGESTGAAYSLPIENLETLLGAAQQSEQLGIPFDWSLNGIDV